MTNFAFALQKKWVLIKFFLSGKDITQKLYALNEHLSGLSDERQRGQRNQMWATSHNRSMSMDAVNTGTTGLVRSQAYKLSQRNISVNADGEYNTIRAKLFCTETVYGESTQTRIFAHIHQRTNCKLILIKLRPIRRQKYIRLEFCILGDFKKQKMGVPIGRRI